MGNVGVLADKLAYFRTSRMDYSKEDRRPIFAIIIRLPKNAHLFTIYYCYIYGSNMIGL